MGDICQRHAGNAMVRRCRHRGDYYVSEMRPEANVTGFMDYVFDGEPWLCEGHYFYTAQQAQEQWELLVGRLEAGDPPDEEKGGD